MECSIAECPGMATRRGWCTQHYQRWRRHNDPLVFRPDAVRGCLIEPCDGAHYGRGWCKLHYDRFRKTGDPLGIRPHFSPLSGKTGDSNPSWRGNDVGYGGVHIRLAKDPAVNHMCSQCGTGAHEWAYDHGDKDARLSEEGLPYSTRSRHYVPLCRPCHRKFDAAHVQAR